MQQLTLPVQPIYEPWLVNCSILLGLANSAARTWDHYPAPSARERFYALKREILLTHGHAAGFDVQHVQKNCWRCGGNGRHPWDPAESCDKCNGTGLYSERWFLLARFRLAGRVFHCPAGRLESAPDVQPTIEGLVQHQPSPLGWDAFRCLADGRYSLVERCTVAAAREVIARVREGDGLPF